MTKQNIKQVRVFKESLPDLSIKNNFFGYRVRYRIVTNDGNNYSAWSPIYDLSADGIVDVANTKYSISINPIFIGPQARERTQVRLVWTPPVELKFYSFDIFVKTNFDSDYIFYRTVNSTSYDIILPAYGDIGEIKTAQFWVQISTSDKKPNVNTKMFPSNGNLDGNLRLDIVSPSITSVSPTSATVTSTSNTVLTITGNGFDPLLATKPDVSLGDVFIDASNIVIVNSTTMTIVAPFTSVTGPATLKIFNPDSQSATLVNAFTYL